MSDEGLGSSAKHYGSGSLGSGSAGSVYLSDSQDWVVSPSCSPDEGTGLHTAISPLLAEETFRYMSKLIVDRNRGQFTSYALDDKLGKSYRILIYFYYCISVRSLLIG